MSENLIVYAYNVLFGDAILVQIPAAGSDKFILIDVGNVFRGTGSDDEVLLTAIRDIVQRTAGHIDLYVMTHEHMDHVQGLLHAANNGTSLQIDEAWLTASAAPDYYDEDKHPKARRKKLALVEAYESARERLGVTALAGLTSIMDINNSQRTDDCVTFIRTAAVQPPKYVHRELILPQPFDQVELRILAPEEDTSDYYRKPVAHLQVADEEAQPAAGPAGRPLPLAGIDGGAFYQLIDRMDAGLTENLLLIDQAANNTSVVIEMTWRGRRLLFTGDAEQGSWRMMRDKASLRPVDFLKIGHHGSHNATPPASILDLVLPRTRKAFAQAVVSTCLNVYSNVPDEHSLGMIEARTSKVYKTLDVPQGTPVVVELSPGD